MARDFARGDFKIPQMQDPAFMYKVVSDERAYQLRLLQERRKVLARIPKAHPKAGELQAKIAEGQETVRMLFGLLKRITGREGATGGTDFLPGSG